MVVVRGGEQVEHRHALTLALEEEVGLGEDQGMAGMLFACRDIRKASCKRGSWKSSVSRVEDADA